MTRKLLHTLLVLGLLAVAAPASAHGDVEIRDSFFDPASLTVAPGKTVLWGHDGTLPHSVTADDGSFDSSPTGCSPTVPAGCMQTGMEFEHTFAQTGSFPYHCKVHPGMTGVINVVNPWEVASEVHGLSAVSSGTSISVAGEAHFGGQAPVTVTTDPAGDAPIAPDLGVHTGVDLVAARLYQPNAGVGELVVEWELTSLPTTGGIPEGTRYSLPFKIGTKEFQVQAKFSNLGSVTVADDPPGHATHVGSAFQLRGNCTTSYQPVPPPAPGTGVAACPHLGWLSGEFDVAKKTVRVRVPLGATFAPEIVAGARLERNTSSNANLNMVIAGYQAFVALSPQTNDEAIFGPENEDPYAFVIPKKEVSLGIAPEGTPESGVGFTPISGYNGDHDFTGTLSTAGLTPGSYEVWARACFGGNCGAESVPITI